MGNVHPTYKDRLRFTLRHNETGSLVITEPVGWRSDSLEYDRHKQYHGIFPVISTSLKFVGDGADFLTQIKENYGPMAKVQLLKDERHPTTDRWRRMYTLDLDMITYDLDEDQVSMKINNSGLEQEVKARDGDKVEIERSETLDGQPLDPLPTKILQMDGRRIFLLSELDHTFPEQYTTNALYSSPPLTKKIDSDPYVTPTSTNIDGTWFVGYNTGNPNETYPQDQQFFYFRNDRHKTIKLGFDIKFRIKFNVTGSANQVVRILVQKSLFNPEGEATPISLGQVAYLNGNGTTAEQTIEYVNLDLPYSFTLEEDECLALIIQLPVNVNNVMNFYTPISTRVVVTEDSQYPASESKMVMAYELVDRLLEINTGRKNVLVSDALGRVELGYSEDGFASMTGFNHGHWIRGFDRQPENVDNKYKPFTTNFKDIIESLYVIWGLGAGIEKVGYSEKFRMEDLTYFYQNVVTVKLPNPISKYKRYYAHDFIYTGVEVGYQKGGDYEQAMGLDEYNTKSNWTSYITRGKKTFSAISPVRADAYGQEFTRRKPIDGYPTTDTSEDQDIWANDIKRVTGNIYRQRKWQDDFSEAPTGVYSPETATNLRYSPGRIMRDIHGWEIVAGLQDYPDKYLRFGGSVANRGMTTKLIGDEAYTENQEIKNKDLAEARFVAEYLEIEHIVDFDVLDQLNGTTIINGRKVPNMYGLIEFHYKGKRERGFLVNLKPNGTGKWKLLKAAI